MTFMLSLFVALVICTLLLIVAVWAAARRESLESAGRSGTRARGSSPSRSREVRSA
jgi:hypothetical protein